MYTVIKCKLDSKIVWKKSNKHIMHFTWDAEPEPTASGHLLSADFRRWNRGPVNFPCDLPRWRHFSASLLKPRKLVAVEIRMFAAIASDSPKKKSLFMHNMNG